MNKKHLFLCLLMAILVPSVMFGQDELTVFEGTATSREAPMYVYFFDDYTRAQTVFPATELEDMVGSPITAIKFYTTSSNIPYTTVSSFDIYLTEVEGTSISSFVDRSDATTVYSGTNEFVATSNGGEITITFSTPYVYQGGNLLFGCDNITDSGFKEINFYGQSKTGASISGYNSSASGTISPTQRNFIPKTTFIYTPSCPRPNNLTYELTPGDGTIVTLSWTERGEATSWQICLNDDETNLIEVTENPYTLTGLTPETAYTAKVRSNCGEEQSNWSNVIHFKPTDSQFITVNDGTASNEYIPVYGYYCEKYSRSQFIIPAGSLVAMTNGEINRMMFYSNDESIGWGNAQFKVYLSEVQETTISSFYDWNDMEEVYEGSLSINHNTMEIEFAQPYYYFGGNLLVGINEIESGSYKECSWLGVYASGASIGGYENSKSYSQQNFLPKMTVFYEPGVAPSCSAPESLAASELTVNSAQINWVNGGSEEDWNIYVSRSNIAPTYHTTGTPISEKPYSLVNLNEATTYYVWIRANCGGDNGVSEWCAIPASFTTMTQTPVVITPENSFTDGFENDLNWGLINGGLTNAWKSGSATNNGGSKALYISNDNGTTNAYDIHQSAMVYATKLFTLEQGAYHFEYDWKAKGELSSNTPYDYLRVALVPANTALTAGTSAPNSSFYNNLPSGWIALDGGGQLSQSTDWVSYSEVVNITTTGDYKVVFAWRNDGSGGTQPPAAIDNFSVSVSQCNPPADLQANNVTFNSAQLNWTNGGSEEAWEIYVSNFNVAPTYHTAGIPISAKPYNLQGLNEETTNYVWIRANYGGENGLSSWCVTPVSFTTISQTPIVITEENGYTDDFEGGLNWCLVNGNLTNKWISGTATNNGGSKALYVSNDNGLTNAYDISKSTMVYATKLFTLGKGTYHFEYDWKAKGELSSNTPYDYLRVALVPANTTLAASTSAPSVSSGEFYNNLPSGWIALDGGNQLNQSSDWVSFSDVINITNAGDYKVVFAWRNDGSGGTQPPAAIDNFSFVKLPCTLSTEIAAFAMFTTAELSWTEPGYASQWNLQWKATGASEWNMISNLDETSYSLTDLTSDTEYEFRVQPACTDEYWSEPYIFTTRCEAYDVTQQTTFKEGFESNIFPPDCWENVSYVVGTYTRSWSRSTGDMNIGSASAYSGYYGPIYLNMPVINISQEAMYAELSFWSRVSSVNYYSGGTGGPHGNHDGLSIVKVSTDYGRTWTQLWCPTIEELPAEGTWEKISLNLTNFKNQDILIAFEYQGNNAHGWYVDDLAVTVYDKVFLGGSAEDATAWFNAGNWQPDGVPTLEQNVYITAPAIIAESSNAAQANTIDFAEQGSLTIADGGQLMTNNETTATVKKNIVGYGDSKGGYYLIANPLTNTISPVNAGFITTESDYDLYDWDYSANDGLEWRNYKEHNFNLYNSWGSLYANESDVELSFNGSIKANNIPVTRTTSYSSGYEFGGWRLYGNPFVCDAYLHTESTEIAFFRMNATGDGFETATGAIHPLEGFFVQVTASGQSLTISREAPAQRGQLNLNLSRNNRRLDNAIVIFGEGRNLGKLSFRENSSKVYIPMEGKDCAAVFTTGMGEIPVNFKPEEKGTYTLDFANQDVAFNYLHLIDNLTGIETDLLETPYYTFNAQTTDYASRFRLVFATGSSVDGDSFGFLNSNGNFTIFGIDGEATLQVIDVLGHVLSTEQFSGSYEKKISAAPGVYMVRLIQGNDVKVQKVVVR